KATGVNFTEYLSRVRIEKAKNLLLNPNLRISEIAYEVGFQSLTHFNRVFKKVAGESPTEYRMRLPKTAWSPYGRSLIRELAPAVSRHVVGRIPSQAGRSLPIPLFLLRPIVISMQ